MCLFSRYIESVTSWTKCDAKKGVFQMELCVLIVFKNKKKSAKASLEEYHEVRGQTEQNVKT